MARPAAATVGALFAAGALLLAGGATPGWSASGGPGYLGMSLPPESRIFSADSPWNTPIPAGAIPDPASPPMIANLVARGQLLRGSFRSWTIPIFVIDAKHSPRRSVRTTDEHLHPSVDPDDDRVAVALPLPEGVWPDPQRDGHLALVDPVARRSWEFSRARRLPSGDWEASRVAVWDLDGPGYGEPYAGKFPWTFGATGSGMPLIAGVIRPEEVRTGEIRHALLFASPVNRRELFPGGGRQLCSPPAARSDGQGIGPEFIPVGARLQLDPALDLDALGLSPGAKVVARALQRFGMYNGMGSSHFKLFFQNLGPGGGEWGELMRFDDLRKIPVERFRVLPCTLVTREGR